MTEIINLKGDKFYYDLTNYPQTPPVLPSDIYNKLFDQVNGLRWNMWTELRKEIYGPSNIEFIDPITNKTYKCNQSNIRKTKGKKVMVDHDFKGYCVDDIGDKMSNVHYDFHYTTDKERDTIVSVLDFIFSNNYNNLFRNRSGMANTFIPGIRIND